MKDKKAIRRKKLLKAKNIRNNNRPKFVYRWVEVIEDKKAIPEADQNLLKDN